jgi:capsule synthesis protein PGA_cap
MPRLSDRVGYLRLLPVALSCAALLGYASVDTADPSLAATSPPTSPPSEAAAVTLEWVGDIAFSSEHGLPPGGPARAFAPVRRELERADITFGNLEGTLSTGGASKCKGRGGGNCFAFQAPPSYARGLMSSGFDLLNLANNHANDYGPGGEQQTVTALEHAGLAYTGRPGQFTTRRAHGLRIAFVGFAPYPWAGSLTDIGAAQKAIRRARRHAPLVVAIIHAGAEGATRLHTPHGTEYYLGENRGNSRRFAHAAIDAGASLVVGSGPHVIRGVERYRNRLIAYSLGNFAGPHTLAIGGPLTQSAILRVTLDEHGRIVGGRWISLRLISPGLPRLDPSHASAKLVARLSREDFSHRYQIFSDGTINR